MQAKRKILVTGTIDDVLQSRIAGDHHVEVIPFIRIEPVADEELRIALDDLVHRDLSVVFTSNNAVKAAIDLLEHKPDSWKLYSIEGVTSRAVQKYFGEDSLAATAYSGEELAARILESERPGEVIFFCGDLRRDELPERLRVQHVQVRELIVYNTVATPVRLEMQHDAILFFSPSAVYSYVALNVMAEHTVCFAIGNTTANTIKNIVPNKVITAQPPQKERVIDLVLEYYAQEN
jgi:uroporphyrinogen-III synthase